jgi:hypothetical protein
LNFTITAQNIHGNASLTNFSAHIEGVGTFSDTAGTITTNITSNSTRLYNVTAYKTGYFNVTYENYNVSSDLLADLYQSILNVRVYEPLRAAYADDFTTNVSTDSTTTTTGITTHYLNTSTYSVTVYDDSFDTTTESVTLSAAETTNLTINVSSGILFRLYDEKTLDPFWTNETQTTTMTIYCPTSSQEVTFNASANQWNKTVYVNCQWTFMKMDLTYADSSYFRTLISDYNETTIDWYLPDPNEDLVVQIILTINDLTGEFEDGVAVLEKAIESNEYTILEQYFDVESSVTAYLIKDGLYTLTLRATDGTTRSVGFIIPDAAGEKQINVPDISFVPSGTVGSYISYSWSDNATPIRFNYVDSGAITTNVTFKVYNGTSGVQVYLTSAANPTETTFSYAGAENESYVACFNATITGHENVFACKPYLEHGKYGRPDGFDEDNSKIFWNALCCLVILLMLGLSYYNSTMSYGMISAFMYVAIALDWLNFISTGWDLAFSSIVAAMAVFSYFVEVINK